MHAHGRRPDRTISPLAVRRSIEKGKALGLTTVSLTGGEPLACSDLSLELVAMAKSHGLEVGLLTNGHLLTDQMADALSSRGLDWVRLSADAAPEDTQVATHHRRSSNHLPEVIEALRTRAIGVILRATVSSANAGSLVGLVRFALESHVERLELQPCFPCGVPAVDRILVMPPSLHLQTAATALRLRRTFAPALDLRLYSGWFEFLCDEYAHEPVIPSRCGRQLLFLDSLGRYKTCGPSRYVLGLADDCADSLRHLWLDHTYLRMIRDPIPTGVCVECGWFSACRYWCPAVNTLAGLAPNAPVPTCPRVASTSIGSPHQSTRRVTYDTHSKAPADSTPGDPTGRDGDSRLLAFRRH